MKKNLLLLLLAVFFAVPTKLFAQLSPSGQLKVITPSILSACAADTIWVELTNKKGPTCTGGATTVNPIQVAVTIPGSGILSYQSGTVDSDPGGATEVSYTGNVLTMDIPAPAFGTTTRAWFVINSTCDVTTVDPLPEISLSATYPVEFNTPVESWTSSKMNTGIGKLTIIHSSATQQSVIKGFGENLNYAAYIENTGFGKITKLTYHQIVHDSLPGYIANRDHIYSRRYRSKGVIATTPAISTGAINYPDYQVTDLGNGYRYYSVTFSGDTLDREDGQMDPGDMIQVNATYLRSPTTCIDDMYQYQWVTYECIGGGTQCSAAVDTITRVVRISAGVPIISDVNTNIETWDGCTEKNGSFTFKNTGIGDPADSNKSVAFDVDLGLAFKGKLLIDNLTLGGVSTVPTTPSLPGVTSSVTWNLKDQNTVDFDGPGGIEDLDGDGYYDDIRPGDSVNVTFTYTVDCDLACGADLYYDIRATSKFTDYCGKLNGSSSDPMYEFGFKQTQPVQQITPIPNYGTMSGSEIRTEQADFTLNYEGVNISTANASAKLRINYSKTMTIKEPIVFMGTTIPLSSFTQIGSGSNDTTGYNQVTDVDSALEYTLTAAQVTALLDNTQDDLSYWVSHISCDSFQNQSNNDGFQILFQINSSPCPAPNTAPPCELDLACNKAFAYQITEGCGVKPCYQVVDSIYRSAIVGTTSEDQTTAATPTPAGTSKFYEGDTLTFLRTAQLSNDYPQMEAIGSTPGGVDGTRDFYSYFSFSYNKDPNTSMYDNPEPPYQFIPGISRVRVIDTTTNTVIHDIPLEYDDFRNIGGYTAQGNRSTSMPWSFYTNVTDNPSYAGQPDINSVPGVGLGDYWCGTGSWPIDQAACPFSDLRVRALNTISYAALNSEAGDRMSEQFYIYFGRALAKNNIFFEPGYRKYVFEIDTKWRVNPEYDHQNVASLLEKGGVARTGDNVSNIPGTQMGTCSIAQGVATVITKEVAIKNAGKTYDAACGLTVCNEIEFNSPNGDFFPSEVRVPFKLDSFTVDMPTEYSLTAAPTFSGSAGGPANSIVASGTTGHLVFTNSTANSGTSYMDFPRINDSNGFTTAWSVCYPISNVGTDNNITESYKVPVTYYMRDESGEVFTMIDTFNISEATPAITLAPLGGSVSISDGGACGDSYMDVLVSNNTIYAADNVFIAVESNPNVTVTGIEDAPGQVAIGNPIEAGDTSWYGGNNLYTELGGMSAGGRRIARIYFNTTSCGDSLKVISNFGCNYPLSQQPEYPSNTVDSAYITFGSIIPGIMSGPIDGNKSIVDLCSIQTLEVEVRNVKSPNLTNILAGIKLPPNAVYVASSAEIAYPTEDYVAATGVTLTGTDSITIDISADVDLANACGLSGSDESEFPGGQYSNSSPNVFRFKFDIDFNACPTGAADALFYNVKGENYCGTEVSTKGVFNLIYDGTTASNSFSCYAGNGKPIEVCSDSGFVQPIMDTMWVKNEEGPTTVASASTMEFIIANDTSLFDIANYSVMAPWTAPTVSTNAEGRTVLTFSVPAGIASGDSTMLILGYDLTPKVHNVCTQNSIPCASLAHSVSFFSEVLIGCTAKGLNCTSLGQIARGADYVPRDVVCCPAGLGDRVWLDANEDGIQDPGETGVAGVQVDLYNNGPDGLPNTADDELVGTTVTDAYGNYYFDGIDAGDYNLGFTPPTNYTYTTPVGAGDNGTPDNSDVGNTPGAPDFGRTGTYSLLPGEQDSTIDVGLILPTPPPSTTASVGNYVWHDLNKDGIQDPNETGISGVTVQLLDATGNVVATTITDGSGMYNFADVDSGAYSIKFSEPIGMIPTSNSGPVNDTSNSDADPVTLTSGTFTVNPGDTLPYIDAGFYLQDSLKASISDKVWYDANGDGVKDADEAGTPGVTVYLYAGDGTTILDSTVTDPLGNYVFNDLPAGDYVVGFDQSTFPPGFVLSPQNAGTDPAKDSDADPTTGKTGVITLQPGEKNTTVDAGIDNPTLTNSIGDYVWNDADKDGIQDTGEAAVAGVTVKLYDNTGAVVATTLTDKNGFYLFPELANGDYTVGFSNLPDGYGFTEAGSGSDSTLDSDAGLFSGKSDTVSLTGNTNVRDLDAGIYNTGSPSAMASLGDRVFVDLDSSGTQNSSETGVEGVKVYLYADDGTTVLDSTVTDSQGDYIFTNLNPGGYVVGFDLNSLPAGYTPTTQDAQNRTDNANDGSDETDSDADVTTGKTSVINLAAGEDNLGIDLGITPPVGTAALGNRVWYDSDQDGIQTAGGADKGVEGVQVELLDDAGNVLATTTTNEDGYYYFHGLAPGSYATKFSNIPDGYQFTEEQAAGSTAGNGSDADTATGITQYYNLAAGERYNALDAGIYSTTKAALGDYVWFDTDGDGIQDSDEMPIPGVLVTVYDASNNPVATTVTDAHGKYWFPNLDPGTYTVGFENLPEGTEFTSQETTPGTDGSDVDPTTGRTGQIVLAAGDVNEDVDAGVKTTEKAGLGNYVWNDENEDGIQDPGESGVGGVLVTLYEADGTTVVATTTTDGDGAYSFTNLEPGDYVVGFSNLPYATTLTTPSGVLDDSLNSDAGANGKTSVITLAEGEFNDDVDAGIVYPKQGLGDYVWLDDNEDGIQDANEVGVAGVEVDVYDNGPDGLPNTADDVLVGSTITDAYGKYFFDDLPTGNYNLGFTPPANYTFTNPVGSGDNGTPNNSDVDNTQGSPNFGRTGTYTLEIGEQDSTIDVGLVLPVPTTTASVGDYVWNDENQDGVQDPTEKGIAGVTVQLLDNTGSVVATTITDGTGMYNFADVPAGTYSVKFTEPVGMIPTTSTGGVTDTSNSDADPVTLTSGTFTVSPGDTIDYVDAGFYLQDTLKGALGDKVWYDANNDGIQDDDEAGVPDVTVYLYAADGTTVLDSTVTDPLGNYVFNDLAAGDYVVGFEPTSLPAGYSISPQNAGTDDTKNSDADPTTGKTAVITLQPGEKNMSIDAGIDNPTLTNSIGDYVWNDANKDGIQDAGEAAVAGVTVTLYDNLGAAIGTTVTDKDGFYLFPELPNGDYSVGFSNLPVGYGFTAAGAGTDSTADSDADVVTGKTQTVSLTGNTDYRDLDAGIYNSGNSSATASLGDKIWVDVNGDGLQNNSEPGVPGITVYLYDADGTTLIDSTETNTQGNYIFTDLPAGGYVVGFDLNDLPAGYTPVTQDQGGATDNANDGSDKNDSDADATTGKTAVINLAAGDDNLGIDLGVSPPAGTASLGDRVWYDANQDGQQDGPVTEPGVEGVQVELLDSVGNVIATTVTNNHGYYKFTGLDSGTYSVRFSDIPDGYQFTTQAASGVGAGLNSDADTTTGETPQYTLATGQDYNALDAGIFSTTKAALGDYVWFDTNGDGVQDAGEQPIPGVSVTLYDNTGTPVASTVTDADGQYWFPNLDPGTYTVGFDDLPVGTVFTTQESTPGADGSDVDPTTGRTDPITLAAGDVNKDVDAGVTTSEKAGLGDFVWNDENKDGIQDPEETGVAGVLVTLYEADGTTVVATTTTDGDGAYSFTNLEPGDYVVGFSNLPYGTSLTTPSGVLDDSLNSDAGANGKTSVITLAEGEFNDDVDAGVVYPTQGLGDYVWLDDNKDGIQDANEAGVAGVQVDLFANGPDGLPNTADDVLVGSTTTDAYGKYYFDDLPTGDYNLGFTPPANYTFTNPVGSGDNGTPNNSDVDNTQGSPNFGRTGTYTLEIGEQDSTIDVGLVLPVPTTTASVGDYVWNDTDQDGVQDPTEKGIAGVTVQLLDNTGSVVATTITDGTGMYNFADVPAGTYSVKFTEPVGMIPTTSTGGVTDTSNSDADPVTLTSGTFTVSPGDTIDYVDAGFYLQDTLKGALGDKVWYDANNDGIQDDDEAGVPDVTVYLYAANGTTILDSTTTDGLGNYIFNDLTAGDYVVGFEPSSLPTGFVFSPQNAAGADSTNNSDADATTGKTAVITLQPGEKNMRIDAGIDNPTLTNSIGDYVWNDANKDGIQDAGEAAVAGVTVTLYDNLGAAIGTTVTDKNGFYLFPELPNGDYSVGFSNLPVGYGFTAAGAGTDSTADSDADVVTGKTQTVSLTGNTDYRDLDAGIYNAGSSSATASLGDKIWVDLNGDNLQDVDEPGLAGVTVYLYEADGTTVVDSTVTDAQGTYIFTDLEPGGYVVGFDLNDLPAGYTPVTQDAGGSTTNANDGTDANDSDADATTGKTAVINLAAGDDNLGIDLGVTPPAGTASLGNYVWYDQNKDGIQDPTEVGVDGVQVDLLDASGNVVGTTTTNSEGYYAFTGLTPGDYSVKFSQYPDGYQLTTAGAGSDTTMDSDADSLTGITAPVTLTAGMNYPDLDAGIFSDTKAALGDYVWFDTNGDGIQDPTEQPISGVLVTLYDNTGTPVSTTVTDGEGKYFFPNLDPGTYTVGFTNLPVGTVFTTQESTPGANGSDVDPTTGRTNPVTLAAGDVDTDVDAGVTTVEKAGLGDFVWNDINEDGIQDPGEPGVAGVLVTLYAADGTTEIATTTTDGDGSYSFKDLEPGDYVVGFSNFPIGYTPTIASGSLNDPLNNDMGPNGKTSVVTLGPGDYNPNIDAGIYIGIPLPVDGLVATYAELLEDNKTRVNWYTLAENNTDMFIIERSVDGLSFEEVGTTNASGTTTAKVDYNFEDDITEVKRAEFIYYRIKSVDIDNKYQISNVISVRNIANENTIVYPIPFNNEFNITYESEEAGSIDVVLTDMTGKIIRTANYQVVEGTNRFKMNNLDDLAQGNYFLKISNNESRRQFGISIQKK